MSTRIKGFASVILSRKSFITFCLYWSFFASGLNYNIVSPTLIQLQSLMNVSLTEVSLVYTARSGGYIAGAPLGAFLMTFFGRQLTTTGSTFIISLSIFLIPSLSGWSPSSFTKLLVYLAAGINGTASGIIESGVNVWLLDVWGSKSTPFMQALHFSFSFGCAIAPLIASLFLKNEGHIVYSYWITALIELVSFLLFLIISVTGSTGETMEETMEETTEETMEKIKQEGQKGTDSSGEVTEKTEKETLETFDIILKTSFPELHDISQLEEKEDLLQTPEVVPLQFQDSSVKKSNSVRDINKMQSLLNTFSCSSSSFSESREGMREKVILLSCLFMLFYSGTSIIYNQFMPSFLQTSLHVSSLEASYIHSTLNYASTLSRAIGILVALKLSPQAMIIVNLCLFNAGSLFLLTFSCSVSSTVRVEIVSYIGNIIIGLGMGSVSAPLLSYLKKHVEVTNVTGSVFVFCSGLTSVFVPLLVASVMSKSPSFLLLFNVVNITLSLIIFIFILRKVRSLKRLIPGDIS